MTDAQTTAPWVAGSSQKEGGGTVLGNLAVIAPLYLINAAGVPGNALFFLILMRFLIKSGESSVKALSLMYLVLVGNTAIVSTGNVVFGAGKFLFLILFCARMVFSLHRKGQSVFSLRMIPPLILFALASFLLALEGNYFFAISTMKLFAFLVGAAGMLLAIEVMRDRPHDLDSWFFSLFVFILIMNIFYLRSRVGL